MAEEITFRKSGNIGVIEINRPAKKNALNFECWQALGAVFTSLCSTPDIKTLVLTGSGHEVFSAGVDVNPEDPYIQEMMALLQKRDKAGIMEHLKVIHDVIVALSQLPFPTIAALNGDCYSGAIELSLGCDIRVARENSVIAFQETMLGLIPDLGGTVRLMRTVGPSTAKELIFSCRKLGPKEAKELGLVQRIFPENSFMDHVMAYAGEIASKGPRATQAVKAVIDSSHGTDMDRALENERAEAAETILSGECLEGIAAFFDKRLPDWK